MVSFEDICPVVDVANEPSQLYDALQKRGYCWIVNSGFTDDEVRTLQCKSRQWWDLPREQKLAYRQGTDVTFSGYIPWGIHRPTSATPKHLREKVLYDFKEAFDFMHPQNKYSKIPSYAESADFFNYATEFFLKAGKVGGKIIDIVADCMNNEQRDGEAVRGCFNQLSTSENMSYMRTAFYPGSHMKNKVTDIEFGENTSRIGIHADAAPFVAMIWTTSIKGLQIEDHEHGWFDVEHLGHKDAMWIHVGQLGYHVTDGAICKPLLHRVVLPDGDDVPDRYVTVNFLGADGTATIPAMTNGETADDRKAYTGLEWVSKALITGKPAKPLCPDEEKLAQRIEAQLNGHNGHVTNGH